MTSLIVYILQMMQSVYPDLYRIDDLNDEGALHEEGGDSSDEDGNTEIIVPQPERLQVLKLIVSWLVCPKELKTTR